MSTPPASKKTKSIHTGIIPSNPYNTQSQSIINTTAQKADTIPNTATVSPASSNKKTDGMAQGEDDSKCKKMNTIINQQPCGDKPLQSIKRVNKGLKQTTMTQQFKMSTNKNDKEETSTKDYSFSFSCSPSYSSQDEEEYDSFDSLIYTIGGNTKIQCENDKFCDVRGFMIGRDGQKIPSHYCHACRCPPIKCHERLLGQFIELDIVSEVMDAKGTDLTPRDIENAVREKYEWHFKKVIYDDTKTLDVRKYKLPLCIEQKTLGRLYDYIKVSSYHDEKMKLIVDGRGRRMTKEMLAERWRQIEEDAS
jgi:hypothetical protein